MDSKFGFSIVDNNHHRRETRYLVERTGVDTYQYVIYRRREGSWKECGEGIVENCRTIEDFAQAIAIRLGPSDYEWEPMDHNAITY